MNQPVSSDGDQRPWRHEDDWRREQYDALARCDNSEDTVRDLLVDIDDDGARRIVLNSKVILDEITKGVYLDGFAAPTRSDLTLLTEKERLRVENVKRLLQTEAVRMQVARRAAERLAARQTRIQYPPAHLLDHWLQVLVSKKSYERIYSQMILDIREEYFEALAAKKALKARLILVRGYLSVARALVRQLQFIGAVIRALRG